MTRRSTLPLLLLLALLSACAALTPQAPQSPAQALLVAEHEYQALLQTATDLRAAGAVDDVLYLKLDNAFREANTALGVAWVAYQAGDMTTTTGQIAAARSTLLLVRGMIAAGGVK